MVIRPRFDGQFERGKALTGGQYGKTTEVQYRV